MTPVATAASQGSVCEKSELEVAAPSEFLAKENGCRQ